MPRKRPVETRLLEQQDKMDKLTLEKTIKDLRAKFPRRRRRKIVGRV